MTLDAGGELAVIAQNVATSSMEALALKDKAVSLTWDRRHTLPVAPDVEPRDGRRRVPECTSDEPEPTGWAVAAVSCSRYRGRHGVGAEFVGEPPAGPESAPRRPGAARAHIDLSQVGGPGEGQLNIIAWIGYAEAGANLSRIRLGQRRSRSRPAAS